LEYATRPRALPSCTHKVRVGCGNLYITVTSNEESIVEVFAMLGKSGGCSMCQNEALCRSISIGLRSGVPVDSYVKTLKGIGCPNPIHGENGHTALSCPDAVGKVLELELQNGKESTHS